ncbi:MAG: class I SAM-dependent methyltransferase, partial [Tepidiformaceae bacterium]
MPTALYDAFVDANAGYETNHRWFAAFWERAVRREGPANVRNRTQVVSGVRGRVLELGVGLGSNWRYLPEGVDYVGVEPDIEMLRRARLHAAEQSRSLTIEAAGAESLPFAADEFDSAFGTLVLCSVRDTDRALSELFRVLKPGAEYRFWEHVRPAGRVWGPIFAAATPAWSRIGAGCHLNRRTVDA